MPSISRSKLEIALRDAPDYATWKRAALAYDKLTGKDKWRKEIKSPMYDHKAIRLRLMQLRKLRAENDYRGLLFTLNQGIHGNLGGMGSAKLYRQAKFGTKQLINDYIDEIVDALWQLAKTRTRSITFAERLEFFHRADHCYGQSALMLSGGAMLAHFHLGVAKALTEADMLPNVISGSSGGAFVAGVLGTHTHDELEYFFDPANLVLETQQEASFMANFWPFGGGRLDIKDLQDMLERSIPDVTFAEAFEISGRWINISIAPYEQHQSSRLLNAITSPNVYVRKAVEASCAVPGLFPPVVLEAKTKSGNRRHYLPSRRWVDGSVTNDLPAKRLARLYGVNHYIASQVNPFALWFLQDPKARQGIISTGLNAMIRSSQEWLRATQPLTNKVVRSMPNIERLYRSFYSVATQQYTGDITVRPRSRFFNPARLLKPLTERELLDLISEGEQVTYPKIEMVRNCTRISRALQDILKEYDQRALRYSHRAISSNMESSNKKINKPAA